MAKRYFKIMLNNGCWYADRADAECDAYWLKDDLIWSSLKGDVYITDRKPHKCSSCDQHGHQYAGDVKAFALVYVYAHELSPWISDPIGTEYRDDEVAEAMKQTADDFDGYRQNTSRAGEVDYDSVVMVEITKYRYDRDLAKYASDLYVTGLYEE